MRRYHPRWYSCKGCEFCSDADDPGPLVLPPSERYTLGDDPQPQEPGHPVLAPTTEEMKP